MTGMCSLLLRARLQRAFRSYLGVIPSTTCGAYSLANPRPSRHDFGNTSVCLIKSVRVKFRQANHFSIDSLKHYLPPLFSAWNGPFLDPDRYLGLYRDPKSLLLLIDLVIYCLVSSEGRGSALWLQHASERQEAEGG